MKRLALALLAACTAAHADVVPYTPGTLATFGDAGKFNSTIYLTIDKALSLNVASVGACATTPCQPDVVQVYTRTGYRVVDIALRPSDAWGGVTLMLPAGAYLVHVTGGGDLTRLQVSTK